METMAILNVFLCLFAWYLWRFLNKRLSKSALDNIPGPLPESFAKGNFGQLYHRQAWDFHSQLWKKYGPIVKLQVLFGARCLYIYDPKVLHHILASDQTLVDEPAFISESYRLVHGPCLMSATGDEHRRQRKLLNPVFSTQNLRDMLTVVYKVVHKLEEAIALQARDGPQEVNVLHWTGRTSLEIIGQAGLGYSFDPIVADASDDYATALKALFPTLARLGFARQLTPVLVKLGPPAFRRRVMEWTPNAHVQKLLSIVDTMDAKSRGILRAKKAALKQGDSAVVHQVGDGKDLMSCLLRANMEAEETDKLSDEEIRGQMSSFVLAATDTTSSVLAQILQHLARHPDKQERLRNEIMQARRDGDVPYDELMRLPYLDAVVRETLRLNPPASLVSRQLQKDTVAPLSPPIRGVDGTMMHEIHISKGTVVFIGVLASNRNKAVWGDDALEWKPERWLSPLPDSVAEARIPGVFSSLWVSLPLTPHVSKSCTHVGCLNL
ncbi:hypothetical protein AcW2_004165 [Taiwanofungus camphoratus]|nr:hypothetical protein AcW2_004165 [Antrodia cinnamomea]